MAFESVIAIDNGRVISGGGGSTPSPAVLNFDLMDKLWENSDPSVDFSAGDITLSKSSSEYDMVLIVGELYKTAAEASRQLFSATSPVTSIAIMLTAYAATSTGSGLYYREATCNGAKITFSDCKQNSFAAGSTIANSYCIPCQVYGIKNHKEIELSCVISDVSTSADKCMLSDGVTSVESTLSYSSAEHKIGKWIDGSDLYEKTVDCGMLPNNGSKNVSSGLTNVNVVSITGIGIITGGTSIPIPFVSPGASGYAYNVMCDYVGSTNDIVIMTGNDRTDCQGYITLRYTKTA